MIRSSHLFKCTVVFSKSTFYLRCMTVLYGFAAYSLYGSGVPILGKILCGLILIFSMIYIVKNPRPYQRFRQLNYVSSEWILTTKAFETQRFERHRVLLDVGIFFLLHLSSAENHQVFVIFFDQISPDDYRSLRILEKII